MLSTVWFIAAEETVPGDLLTARLGGWGDIADLNMISSVVLGASQRGQEAPSALGPQRHCCFQPQGNNSSPGVTAHTLLGRLPQAQAMHTADLCWRKPTPSLLLNVSCSPQPSQASTLCVIQRSGLSVLYSLPNKQGGVGWALPILACRGQCGALVTPCPGCWEDPASH